MFLHNVHYWLKRDLTEQQRETFLGGVAALRKLESVRGSWFGKPAATDRPVIDRSYDYGLVLDLGDAAGHEAFQADPEHQAIRDRIGESWDRILIYDIGD